MSTLKRDDVEYILWGATFLGAGGGGPLTPSIVMLNKLEKEHKVQLELLDLDQITAVDYGAMVACLGSPEAMKKAEFGPDAVNAYEVFQKALALENKQVKYLYSGEMGGLNTLVPMLVAVLSSEDPSKRIKMLDVDANGRAVPELNTSLNAARGFAPYPVGMGSMKGNKIVAYGISDEESEKIARALCQIYGSQIGFSTWAMNKLELKNNSVVGCVSKAREIGYNLMLARHEQKEPIDYLKNIMTCRLFSSAYITDKQTKQVEGFDIGVTTLQDIKTQETFTIYFQNENLVLLRKDGSAAITVPELISMVCRDNSAYSYMPLDNATTQVGMRVDVILSPANDLWWNEDHKAYEVWIPCLKRAGYTGKQVRYK